MTKSLRHWLASLFMLAVPGVAFGQQYVGQPHLAPVALEARCRVADGMNDSLTGLRGLGIDPLRLAASGLSAQQSPMTKADVNPFDVGYSGEDVNPFDVDYIEPEISAEPDQAEPAHPSTVICQIARNRATRTSFRRGTDFCPLADFVVSYDFPSDQESATDTVASETNLNHSNTTIAANSITNRFAGSSPVIFSLQEQNFPYDLDPADLKRKHPVKISLLNLPAPKYCMLPADLLAKRDTSVIKPEVASTEEVCEFLPFDQPSAIVDLAEYLPCDEQADFLCELAQPEIANFPIQCWMDELLWQITGLIGPDSSVYDYLDAVRAGQLVADLSAYSLEQIVFYAKPIVPIIVQRQQPLPPPQPLQFNTELTLAGSALIHVAQDLESIAAALRSWGTSIHKVAAGEQPGLIR